MTSPDVSAPFSMDLRLPCSAPELAYEQEKEPPPGLATFLDSAGLTQRSSANNYRGIYATRPFSPGEALLSELPFAFSVSQSNYGKACDNCLSGDKTLQRCSLCKTEWYCSQACQALAWRSWHKEECPYHSALAKGGTFQSLAPTISAKHSTPPSTFRDVQTLRDNSAQLEETMPKLSEEMKSMASFVLTALGAKHDPLRSYKLGDIYRMFHMLQSNCFNITDLEFNPRFAVGLYPISALINHSCAPSAVYVFTGTRCSIFATRPIQPGDEITISYCEVTLAKEKRSESLRDFCFRCQCSRCQADPLDSNPATATAEALFRRSEKVENSDEKISLLRDALRLNPSRHCIYQITTALQLAYTNSRAYDKALEYAEKNLAFLIDLIEKDLGISFWPILALHHNMLASLYRYSDDAVKSLLHGKEALKVLRVSHKGTQLLANLEELVQEAAAVVQFQPR